MKYVCFTSKMTGVFALCATLALLSGCATGSGDFQCPNKGGVMCKRLDQVDTMVDRHELGADDEDAGNSQTVDLQPTQNGAFGNFSNPYPVQATPGEPIRYGETVMRVWMAPYTDRTGDYHEASYMDLIVKKGHWIGHPFTTKKFFDWF